MAQSTLFIPDISGFTRFVKETEINHSQHIIEELMNLLLKEGGKSFQVAEIEGDAVFFFRHNEKLSVEAIEEEAKRMFNAFHLHLLQYKNNRICNCGACATAVDLKLKFVVHSGKIGLAKFSGEKNKPYGEPVIVVHRLLKTKIGLKEYLLFSNDFLQDASFESDGDGFYEDKELGVINFKYEKIGEWERDIPISMGVVENETPNIVGKASEIFDFNINTLHSFISDFQYRHLWNSEAEQIIFDHSKINQVGTEHLCIVKGKDLVFNSIRPAVENQDQLSYGEVLRNPSPFGYFASSYLLTPISENQTRVELDLSASFKWKWQKLMSRFVRKKLTKKSAEILADISRTLTQNIKQVA